jgi:hypothetical protein
MDKTVSRRSFAKGLAGAASVSLLPKLAMSQAKEYKPAKLPTGLPDFPEMHPQLNPRLVKAFVIAAHVNLEKVKEMLSDEPGLLNATWEWGNGDFEGAIEGAGHMGQRDIALYLIEHGARVNIFCAAMLGHLDVVKATLAAHPNLKDSKGPHGIPLIAHAKVGGEHSKEVLEYLESLS